VEEAKVYDSFDVDLVDPAFATGTGTPQIRGFTSRKAQEFVRGLVGLRLGGRDVRRGSPAVRPGAYSGALGCCGPRCNEHRKSPIEY